MSGKSIISKPSSHWHSNLSPPRFTHAELSGQAALSAALSHVPKASTETEQRQEQIRNTGMLAFRQTC